MESVMAGGQGRRGGDRRTAGPFYGGELPEVRVHLGGEARDCLLQVRVCPLPDECKRPTSSIREMRACIGKATCQGDRESLGAVLRLCYWSC